jgi:hypothetical protein
MKDPNADYEPGQSIVWENLSYADRLEICEFIFKKITAEPPCSFRRLIYSRLGFEENAYCPLYYSGGMTITNAISDAFDALEGFDANY